MVNFILLKSFSSLINSLTKGLKNKIDGLTETFNKTISNFETKPYEILQENIEFLHNELRSKDEIPKNLMETQAAVLKNLSLSKPPQQTENNIDSIILHRKMSTN